MKFKISQCKKSEYPFIADIEKNLFDSPLSINDLETMNSQKSFKTWKIHGDYLIGYICYFHVKDEVEIIKLGIMKSHQGKNYGSYLIQKIKSLPIKKIFIEVSCFNKIAINFYIKNGFKKIGIRKNYYILKNNSRTDALRLSCEP